MQIIIDL